MKPDGLSVSPIFQSQIGCRNLQHQSLGLKSRHPITCEMRLLSQMFPTRRVCIRNQSFRRSRSRKYRLKPGVDIPLPHEIKAIVAAATGRWRPIIVTAIFTGLRSSELRGLRWQDVDLETRQLHVRQRADQWGNMDHPKSEAGERSVPLVPIVLNTLREWRLACPKGQMDLVFPNGNGNPENHNNIINRGLKPLMRAAGVCVLGTGVPKYKGLHCFRHWYASWSLNRIEDGGLGLPDKIVQARLGHSTLAMTTDTYSHLFPEQDDYAALAAGERALLGG